MKLISLLYALYVALDNSFSFTGGSLFSTYSSEADASVWLCASFHFSRNGPTETPAEIITQWEIKPVFAALPSSHVANHHFHSLTGVHFLTRRHSGKIRKSKVKRYKILTNCIFEILFVMLVSLWTALIGLVFIKNWMQFYRHVSGSRGYILSFVQKLWCITVFWEQWCRFSTCRFVLLIL